VNANGDVLDPMIIIKSSTILEKWIDDLPDQYLIGISDSGYSNDELSFEWIKHFNLQSRRKLRGVWRVLLLDGYGSHHTREFIQYAWENQILLFTLPPHTTHFLQVLDVGCFQSLKWYHGRMLHWASRTGAKEIKKEDFLATIYQIRRETFRRKTILSGWRATGIYPFQPEVVLKKLRDWETTSSPPKRVRPVEFEDPEVTRPQTPTFNSSDLDKDSVSSNSSRDRELRWSYKETRNKLYKLKWRESCPKSAQIPVLKPGTKTWSMPNDLPTLEAQMKMIRGVIKDTLPPSQAIDIEKTLITATAWAATAESFRRQLGHTKAAEIAREERRRRTRRKLTFKGGVIYASDARAIVKKRKEDEITRQEKDLQIRKDREARVLCNKYKRLLPSIRAAASRIRKRHLARTPIFVTEGLGLLDPDDCQAAAAVCMEKLTKRGLFRPRSDLSEDMLTTAVQQGLVTRSINDPYNSKVTAAIKAKEREEYYRNANNRALDQLDTQGTVVESELDNISNDSEVDFEIESSDAGDSS